jgi:integrase/recombinase XerD
MTKKPTLKKENQVLIDGFLQHLKTLNYSEHTVKSSNYNLKFYFIWLESEGVKLIETNTETINNYFKKLTTQRNQNTGNGLSNTYLNKIVFVIQLFYIFLRLTEPVEVKKKKYEMPSFPKFKKASFKVEVLSKEEIQILLNTCEKTLLGRRDKAMILLYYSCGLRRQEATNLNLEDVDFGRGTLFISKSKTHHQRFVFMGANTQLALEEYVFNVREKLSSNNSKETPFLLTESGKRLSVYSATYIFKKTLAETKNTVLINKKPSLHTLRHSIATHLLQAGMKLDNIALFLGHRSLDSTQIYTHIEAMSR